METAGGKESFFENFKPPPLEDAGLEDCALPPDSIKEAFQKAAAAVRSAFSDTGDEGENEGRCVEDPWEFSSDALVGITDGVNGPSEGCVVEKGGGLTEVPGDKVVFGGDDAEGKVDVVVGPGLPEGGDACVEGLQGLEIGEKSKGIVGKRLETGKDDVEDEEERSREKPTLTEGYDV